MAKAVLLTGSNLGNRLGYMERACDLICAEAGPLVVKSGIYETAPWGFHSENFFLNQAVVINTELSPFGLLDAIQEIEKRLGREREEPDIGKEKNYSSRTMDIDIIFYDDLVMEAGRLTIPHPLTCQRDFVLNPLKEIMPDFVHPVTGQKICDIEVR